MADDYPGFSFQRDLMRRAAEDEDARRRRIKTAWNYYEQSGPEQLRVKPGRTNDNVQPNYAKMIVNKGVSFLAGRDFGIEIDLVETTDDEEWLRMAWRWNHRRRPKWLELVINAAVTGDAIVRLMQPGGRYGPYPRLVVQDPSNVTALWSPGDMEDVYEWVIEWSDLDRDDDGQVYRQRHILQDDGSSWLIVDEQGDKQSDVYREVSRETWPHPFSAIVHCQNVPSPNMFWGYADLEADILALCDALNGSLSNLRKIVRLWAHPLPFFSGVSVKEIERDPEKAITTPNTDADGKLLEMQSDLEAAREVVEMLRAALLDVSETPEAATGRMDNVNRLSALALQMLFGPILQRTYRKRETHGPFLEDVSEKLLVVGGRWPELGEPRVKVIWPPIFTDDPQAAAQTAMAHHQLGASRETLLDRLGFDPRVERERRSIEDESIGDQLLGRFSAGMPV